MIWSVSNDTAPRVVREADGEPLPHYGRRLVLVAETPNGIAGVFVASGCRFTVKGYPCTSIDLFLSHGLADPSAAIRDGLAATRHVFESIAGAGVAVRACDVNSESRTAFMAAGFRPIGEVKAGEVWGIELKDMPRACAPMNCQLKLFEGAAA